MTDPTFNPGGQQAGLSTEGTQLLNSFWPDVTTDIRNLKQDHFRTQELPLARIKKIMKLDEEVKVMNKNPVPSHLTLPKFLISLMDLPISVFGSV